VLFVCLALDIAGHSCMLPLLILSAEDSLG
jgi:hypothetical protein